MILNCLITSTKLDLFLRYVVLFNFSTWVVPWVPEVFSRGRRDASVSVADRLIFCRRPTTRAGHSKDLTETGNRAWKVSGTQGTRSVFTFVIINGISDAVVNTLLLTFASCCCFNSCMQFLGSWQCSVVSIFMSCSNSFYSLSKFLVNWKFCLYQGKYPNPDRNYELFVFRT